MPADWLTPSNNGSPEPAQSGHLADEARIFDAFLSQAEECPDAIALSGPDAVLKYGDVAAESARIGRLLIGSGIKPGDRVVLPARRSAAHVCNMLAILRIGAVMVPLDSEYPDERLRQQVAVARPHGILLPAGELFPTWADAIAIVVRADQRPFSGAPCISESALAAGNPSAAAYILFTSGTTGTPRAVATSHRPVINFLCWQRMTFGLTAADRFTNLCGVSHDMMIRDIFAPLSIGAHLAIPRQEDIFRPGRLFAWCMEQRPTVAHLTPMMGRLLALDKPGRHVLPFRLMFFGGDALTDGVLREVKAFAPAATIVNFYGTTETPQAASFHICDPHSPLKMQPIGRGIDGFQLRIVDDRGCPVPAGRHGEIEVVSAMISMGFVAGGEIRPHVHAGHYRTGDRGVASPSGEVSYLGRADDQVNIRGARIELAEISAILRDHDAIDDALVLVHGQAEKAQLIAYVAIGDTGHYRTGNATDRDRDFHAWAADRLPPASTPRHIVQMARLPLLPNGKIDRAALRATPLPRRRCAASASSGSVKEAELIQCWRRILGSGEIHAGDSFASLHGDSLSYVMILIATEELCGDLPDDWQQMSIAQIAARKAVPQGWLKPIDSAMLIRAISIMLVVALHLKVYPVGGGATSAMFLVSGYLIGRLQLGHAFDSRSSAPIWRLLGRVLVPSIMFSLTFYFVKLAIGRPVSASIPLFYADFMDYRSSASVRSEGMSNYLWYISCFIHMLTALAIATGVTIRASDSRFGVKHCIALLFLIALPLRLVLPGLLDPAIFSHGITPGSPVSNWPTTHFATLMLGAGLANAETRCERLVAALAILAYALTTWWLVGSRTCTMIAAVGLILLYLPQIPFPRLLHVPVIMLAGASLLTYFTHMQAAALLGAIGLAPGSVYVFIGSLMIGVVLWMAWQTGAATALGMVRRLRPRGRG